MPLHSPPWCHHEHDVVEIGANQGAVRGDWNNLRHLQKTSILHKSFQLTELKNIVMERRTVTPEQNCEEIQMDSRYVKSLWWGQNDLTQWQLFPWSGRKSKSKNCLERHSMSGFLSYRIFSTLPWRRWGYMVGWGWSNSRVSACVAWCSETLDSRKVGKGLIAV